MMLRDCHTWKEPRSVFVSLLRAFYYLLGFCLNINRNMIHISLLLFFLWWSLCIRHFWMRLVTQAMPMIVLKLGINLTQKTTKSLCKSKDSGWRYGISLPVFLVSVSLRYVRRYEYIFFNSGFQWTEISVFQWAIKPQSLVFQPSTTLLNHQDTWPSWHSPLSHFHVLTLLTKQTIAWWIP